jgi:hypothetical protein
MVFMQVGVFEGVGGASDAGLRAGCCWFRVINGIVLS